MKTTKASLMPNILQDEALTALRDFERENSRGCIRFLRAVNGGNINRTGKDAGLSYPWAYNLKNRLVGDGYITAEKHDYGVILNLTEKGVKLLEAIDNKEEK